MPVTWTTDEQHNFLKVELPDFLAAQCQHHSPQFLKGLAERWFEKWPERDVLIPDTGETSPAPSTPKEEEKLTTAIINWKKVRSHTLEKDTDSPISMTWQLKTWMHWNSSKMKCTSTKHGLTWFNSVVGKVKHTRSPQAIKIYQQHQHKKIEECIISGNQGK